MNKLIFLSGLLGLLVAAPHGLAQDAPKGAEVLTRGPIHEAFAEPLSENPGPNPIIHQKPPAPIEELPPDQKPEGAHIQWIPGYFAWDETGNDYIWISGLWRATPPGRQWIPGNWTAVGDGWQWVSGYWGAEAQAEVEYLPQPPTSIDMGPTAQAPDANSLYSPGIWVYQSNRYLWRPGFWYPAQANWFYNSARYTYTPAGYIFCDGYWDYPLANRGMVFAPARFSPNVWATPGWNYQPSYAIGIPGLLTSLFVRPGFNRYYFGDYYGSAYNGQGFVPWFDYRAGRNTPDPLFSYARWNARADAQWEGNLRGIYKERLAGNAVRPPITLVQQNEFIKNVTVNKTVQINNKTVNVANAQAIINQMPVAVPLSKFDHKEFKLQPVAKTAALDERKAAQHFAAGALERQKREAQIISQGKHPAKPTDPPTRVKVDLPKAAAQPRVNPAPATPVAPKHVEQPIPKHEPVIPLRVEPPKTKGKNAEPPKGAPPKEKEKEKGKGKGSAQNYREAAHPTEEFVSVILHGDANVEYHRFPAPSARRR